MPLASAEIERLQGQIARLAQAGLPLAPGLRAAAAEMRSRRGARGFNELAAALDRGQPLDVAIDSLGPNLPPHLRGVFLAGLRSGRLESLLEQLVAAGQRSAALGRDLWLALSYPALLIALSFALLTLLTSQVVSVVADVATGFDQELPEQTRFLLAIAGSGWRLPMALLVIVLAIATFFLFGGEVANRLAFRLPLVGPLRRFRALSDFTRLLATLVEGATPLPEALRLAALGTPRLAALTACERLARRIESGDDFSQALAGEPGLAPTLSTTVRWGKDLPALADSLRIAATAYERRAEGQLRVIRAVAAPMAFLVVVGLIGVLLTAIVTPMVKVIESLT